MAPKYKLIYFNGRGYAEPVRLMFAEAGVEYEDFRFQPNKDNDVNPMRLNDQFKEFKESGKNVWGQAPFLEVEGRPVGIAQSNAIYHFVARELGMMGSDSYEAAKIEEVGEAVNDLRTQLGKVRFAKEEDKPVLWEKFWTEIAPRWLGCFQTVLQTAKTGFFVGQKPTFADVHVFCLLHDMILHAKPDALEEYKCLKDWVATFSQRPNIKKWIESRPDTKF